MSRSVGEVIAEELGKDESLCVNGIYYREKIINAVSRSYKDVEGWSLNPYILAADCNNIIDQLIAYDRALSACNEGGLL